MPADLRLRQIAFVSDDCERAATQLHALLGAEVAFRDPHIIHYGLKNVVIPVGGDFIEVVEPVRADASAARYLARRGGEAGYMVILQAANAFAERARLEAAGVAVVDVLDGKRHQALHFHPKAFGGVLTSIDTTPGLAAWRERGSDWDPAGDGWQATTSGDAAGIAAVDIIAPDPGALAAHWAALLETNVTEEAGAPAVALLHGAYVRFVPPTRGFDTGIAALTLRVRDPAAIRARADLVAADGAIRFCGAELRLVAAS